MKRVKMMLLSLLVLGVVGGAMAFKAKFDVDYCTTPVRISADGSHKCTASPSATLTCPNLIVGQKTKETGPEQFNAWCTTTQTNGGDCIPVPNCVNQVQALEFD